jgi:plasmid maintenance system antidote protein VapI
MVMSPIHPGRILRRELTARGLSADALARALRPCLRARRGPRRPATQRTASGRIVDILNGKRAISAETALRLGRYFGNDPQFWLNLQAQYDLAVVTRDLGPRAAHEVERAV